MSSFSADSEQKYEDYSPYWWALGVLVLAAYPLSLLLLFLIRSADALLAALVIGPILAALSCYLPARLVCGKYPEAKRGPELRHGVLAALLMAFGVFSFAGLGPENEKLAINAVFLLAAAGLTVTFLGFEPPLLTRVGNGPAHAGALRNNETLLRGAAVIKSTRVETINPRALAVGGIELDQEKETEHCFISGATGTGKSQIIAGFLRSIRARGAAARAVILDPAGSYYKQFGRAGIDILVNPFDSRSAAWSPFCEIQSPVDYRRIAAALVPSVEGPGKEWSEFGRKILADTLRAMVFNREFDNQKLFRLLDGSPDVLAEYLVAAGINSLTGDQNMRMFSNAKATISPYIEFLEHLPQQGNFSIRKWVKKEGEDGWLFVTYRDDQMGLMRQFVAACADLALLEGLSLEPSPSRRLFFVADELDSLGHIGMLKDAQVKLRKFGGALILGIQTIGQLQAVYGKNHGAILGNCATQVVLRPQDFESAEYMSKLLGEQEIERINITQNAGSNKSFDPRGGGGTSQGWSKSTHTEKRSVMLASDLQKLQNLEGVLVRTGKPHTLFTHLYLAPTAINLGFDGG